MKFVEHHHVDAGERRIGDQAPGEDAFGEEAQASPRARDFFEADLIAHGLADALAHLLRDPASRHARGDAPRFEHQHLAAHQRKQRGRNARGFSRAGRRLDH